MHTYIHTYLHTDILTCINLCISSYTHRHRFFRWVRLQCHLLGHCQYLIPTASLPRLPAPPAQEAKHVAKEIARLQDPNAGYTFMRACQLLDLRNRPNRARLAVDLMRSTMSIGDYIAKLTVERTTTARRRPTNRATNELKDFAA